MESKEITKVDTPPTESVKPKQKRSPAQEEVLRLARLKSYEIRKQKAEEKQIEREEKKIDTKLDEAEKEKEILKLKQIAVENKLDVEINKKQPKPKRISKQKETLSLQEEIEEIPVPKTPKVDPITIPPEILSSVPLRKHLERVGNHLLFYE